jgi:hypothetical protein
MPAFCNENHSNGIFSNLGLGHKPAQPLATRQRPTITGSNGSGLSQLIANSSGEE